jgi:hypothetical protein
MDADLSSSSQSWNLCQFTAVVSGSFENLVPPKFSQTHSFSGEYTASHPARIIRCLGSSYKIRLTVRSRRHTHCMTMGKRHNRRRTRKPRSSKLNNHSSLPNRETSYPTITHCGYLTVLPANNFPTFSIRGYVSVPPEQRPSRYVAWQNQECKEQDALSIEAEQCRLFGGEPGDDMDLCYSMLEYFTGLDYIDS